MRKRQRRGTQWSGFVTGGILVLLAILPGAWAEVRMVPEAAAELDQATTDAVMRTFRAADEAIRARDLDGAIPKITVAGDQTDSHQEVQ